MVTSISQALSWRRRFASPAKPAKGEAIDIVSECSTPSSPTFSPPKPGEKGARVRCGRTHRRHEQRFHRARSCIVRRRFDLARIGIGRLTDVAKSTCRTALRFHRLTVTHISVFVKADEMGIGTGVTAVCPICANSRFQTCE